MSTESAPVEAPAPVADMVSKESYDALKMQLEAKTKSEAAREQRLQRFEEMERKKLVAMQPSIQELVELEVKENPEYAELASVDAWAKELHQTQNVEANLGIARLISCNSARFKRTLDEASAGKESASMLASTLKELEEIKADRDAKALRVTELESLASERQTSLERMEAEFQKAGVLKDKFDFSKASSREAGGASGAATSGASSAAASSSASVPPARVEDALLSYVSKTGSGGLRMSQSGSQHHFLGTSNEGTSGVMAALRAA